MRCNVKVNGYGCYKRHEQFCYKCSETWNDVGLVWKLSDIIALVTVLGFSYGEFNDFCEFTFFEWLSWPLWGRKYVNRHNKISAHVGYIILLLRWATNHLIWKEKYKRNEPLTIVSGSQDMWKLMWKYYRKYRTVDMNSMQLKWNGYCYSTKVNKRKFKNMFTLCFKFNNMIIYVHFN